MWISPRFQLLLVKEYQRLKADEQKQLAWSAKRELSKINDGMPQGERLVKLNQIAIQQMQVLGW